MNRMFNRSKLLILTTLCSISSLTGCQKGQQSFDYDLWSTYSTVKVIKQNYKDYSSINLGESLKIQMMRDEYESTQLIITSKGRQSFDISKHDLVDPNTGKVLSNDKIEIYVQKYIELEMIKHTSDARYFDSGDLVPDMLLPFDIAKRYGENYVDKNSNQGITIEVDSNGVEAGTYKGNVTVSVGGSVKEVPIEVTVWDIAFEGKSSIQSCWLIYSMYMFTGEYDASEHMLDTYADFLSKYKANPYIIQEEAMNSPEAFMQDVERLWKIKNYNSIIIPYDFPLNYNPDSYQGDKAASYIVKLAEKSTEENFYLDYALFYPSTYDEADANGPKKAASPEFFKRGGNYEKTLEKAINILQNKGYFSGKSSEWNERVKVAIRNIPDVFTNCNYIEKWVEEWPATFCPKINVLNSQKYQEVYKDYADENANGDFWTYTCCDPNYPYPSNHLDDDNLSMRVMGWMEKAYDINGYLFYMANMYTTEKHSDEYTTPYIIADRNDAANGDGFIMYPGRLYGSSTPFPSTRLITYRDGLEDYDMLEVFQRKVKAYADKYGLIDLDYKEYVNDIYSSLFHNAIPTEEHEALYKAREELAKRILEFDNEDELLTHVKNDEGTINLHIYSNNSSLNIDGVDKTCEDLGNNRYHLTTPLGPIQKEIKIRTSSSHTYTYNNHGYINLTNFGSSTPNVTMSEESSYEKIGNKIDANIICVQKETAAKTIRFVPSITFSNVDLNGVKKLMFNYSNPSDVENLAFDVDLILSSQTITVGGHFCLKGGEKTMEIDLSHTKVDLSKVKDIRLTFVNYYFDENEELHLYNPREIMMEDIFAMY